MIRRDYLLRQLEEFVAILTKIAGLTKDQQWQEATTMAAGEFQRLAGLDAAEAVQLSETELLARLIRGEPTRVVEAKAFMLATLFKTHGDLAAVQGRLEEGRLYYLKGLHLLLDTVGRNEVTERPGFVPTVEAFVISLHDTLLPLETGVMLMRHYEQTVEYAKAEDILFGLVEAEPANTALLEFGTGFYRRLLELSDRELAAGNLPRSEVAAGLAELNQRKMHTGK